MEYGEEAKGEGAEEDVTNERQKRRISLIMLQEKDE